MITISDEVNPIKHKRKDKIISDHIKRLSPRPKGAIQKIRVQMGGGGRGGLRA
jgi:predicted CopG family antitoxin